MKHKLVSVGLFASLAAIAFAQDKTAGRMEIALEKKEGSVARRADPRHVFQAGDLVRFRYRPNFSGYLYVLNHSTSGKYTVLFPTGETGTQNRLEAGQEYLLPSTESGWFRIEGPAGHEVVYWLVTPAALENSASAAMPLPIPVPLSGPPPAGMTPRCDDTVFRARGDCIDTNAGPRPVARGEKLPEGLSALPEAGARDLVFIRKQQLTLVSAPEMFTGPMIYEFALAHK